MRGENYKNTSSMPINRIKRSAWIINTISSDDKTLKDPHKIAFVVSKTRSFEDYKQVYRHDKRSKRAGLQLTPYSENLLSSCFKGW